MCAQKVGLRRVGFSASGEIGRDEDGMKAGLSQTIKKKKSLNILCWNSLKASEGLT